MKRLGLLLPLLLFLTFNLTLRAQFITASEVERWVTSDYPSSDYNLNSSYVYLLNGDVLREIFAGEDLTRQERKTLGIKRGDYPEYMYLAVQMADPNDKDNDLTIPLLIHDVKDPNHFKRLTGYGGRLLENVPDEVLRRGDITAKVKFESFRGNGSSDFWKKTAQISIELGKTATSLLAAPLTGNFLSLTRQIVPQVTQGLNSLKKTEDDPGRMTSEFYIQLLDHKLSPLYQEKVVAATLYKIHWDVDRKLPRSRFFRNAHPETVDDLKKLVNHTTSTYILVAHTKAEYNTDHSELAYNQQYIEKKSLDYRKVRNAEKKAVEKEFLETLKLSVELKKQIDVFDNSLNTKYPDWQAYSKIIDLYYDINVLRQEQLAALSKRTTTVQEKYRLLYNNVATDIDLWFDSELLGRARDISSHLVRASGEASWKNHPSEQLYEQIELLDFFRDRVQQTEIQGKLPKEIESLETYSLSNRVLAELELALYLREFQMDPTLDNERKKAFLLEKATTQYPLCRSCSRRVGEEIATIENLTHEQNILKYRRISTEYYERLGCYESLYSHLDSLVKANQDSLQMAPVLLGEIKKDKDTLDELANAYANLVGQDYTKLSPEELEQLLSRYYVNREKLTAVVDRLRGFALQEGMAGCLGDGS